MIPLFLADPAFMGGSMDMCNRTDVQGELIEDFLAYASRSFTTRFITLLAYIFQRLV